jgi:hypothetical protein
LEWGYIPTPFCVVDVDVIEVVGVVDVSVVGVVDVSVVGVYI